MIDRLIGLDERRPASEVSAAVRYTSPQSRTTLFEQLLILITIVILPLENHFPAVAGMSVSFLVFATLFAYVVVSRPRVLGKVWYHPVFIAAYVFIAVSALLEFSSPLSRYDTIVRFAFMIGGAVCLAVLCRDRSGLTVGLYGYIAAGLWVSIYLYLASYGTINAMGSAESFHEASKIRAQAFEDKSLAANINTLAFSCTQGAIAAFTLALAGSVKQLRILFFGIAAFCLIASFLPMSRGAAIITLVSFAAILYTRGVWHGKTLILAAILGLSIYTVVPDAVWSRMAYSSEAQDGKMEGRARVYTTAFNRLPEYIVAGVGAGNFWNKWGFEKGFATPKANGYELKGAHNSPLQIAITWGIGGLLSYVGIVWCVYRSIPFRCGRDAISLALLGIIISLGLWMCESHGFYDKWFACGIGMLVGARLWIWPAGTVADVEGNQRPSPVQI